MSQLQPYFSIETEVVAEIVVKASKFIARGAPVSEQSEADNYVKTIAKRFHDATHNCFAYKIGTGDNAVFRFSDAGEPSGTAGRPILQAIESKDLTNVVVIVTRYFGGTKLGTGGLIRAYSGAALAALNKAKIITSYPNTTLRLQFSYQLTNAVHQAVEKYHARILVSAFEEDTIYTIELKAADEVGFQEMVRDLTAGKIQMDKSKCQNPNAK